VLGICSGNKIYHYLFERNAQDQLSIKSGRPFDNLMTVVNFYSQKSEGLLCKLQRACDVAAFEFRPKFENNKNILLHPDIQNQLRRTLSRSEPELMTYRRLSKQGNCPQAFFTCVEGIVNQFLNRAKIKNDGYFDIKNASLGFHNSFSIPIGWYLQ